VWFGEQSLNLFLDLICGTISPAIFAEAREAIRMRMKPSWSIGCDIARHIPAVT